MFNKETVIFNNTLYYIHRRIPIKRINEKYHTNVNILLEPWNCDLVLRSNNNPEDEEPYFLFLRKIEDAKITE